MMRERAKAAGCGVPAALLVFAVGLAPRSANAEELRNVVDKRPPGAGEAGQVVFSWKRPQGGAAGHAVIAVLAGGGENHALRTAWGVWSEGGLQAGSLDGDALARLRAGAEGSLTVRVAAEQLDHAATLLASGAQQHAQAPPAQACDNVAYGLMAALGLKAPYRGGFAPADPFNTFRDLTRINRPPKAAPSSG